MESSKETDCQAQESPSLCINNCGFFGSEATMNMCSKCHKDIIIKQSIDNIVNVNNEKDPVFAEPTSDLAVGPLSETKVKAGPSRCATCRKRIGLTGFSCRCGDLFCSTHRYSDKHDCPFDYQAAGQDAIAKANPLVKAEKIDKI